MALLTRDQILAADDIKRETVHVAEWGGDVVVRGLTGAERDELEVITAQQRGKNAADNLKNFSARFLSRVLVDEAGKRLFEESDVTALGKKNAMVMYRLMVIAQRLSGISDADKDELTKNSESGQSDSSTSA